MQQLVFFIFEFCLVHLKRKKKFLCASMIIINNFHDLLNVAGVLKFKSFSLKGF
jgi:hypothetical protein